MISKGLEWFLALFLDYVYLKDIIRMKETSVSDLGHQLARRSPGLSRQENDIVTDFGRSTEGRFQRDCSHRVRVRARMRQLAGEI